MRVLFGSLVFFLAFPMAGCLVEPEREPDGVSRQIPADVVCEWASLRRVTDGDTIRVDFEDGPANQPVRYIGVDTPETRHPDMGVQPFGPEATGRNGQLVTGERLCLERDVSSTDRFGRLLRYVWLEDGTLVNDTLVREGFAVVLTIPPDVKYADRFLAAQRQAREARAGVWAE